METEVKIKIEEIDLNRIINLLGNPNFFEQENIIFDLPNGFFRIRTENGNNILTFKSNRKKSSLNVRDEIEFYVGADKESILKFFSCLNFKKSFFYKKFRSNFQYNDCVISVDILPNNENYIEIEGSNNKILDVVQFLDLSKKEFVKKTYQEVLKNETKID